MKKILASTILVGLTLVSCSKELDSDQKLINKLKDNTTYYIEHDSLSKKISKRLTELKLDIEKKYDVKITPYNDAYKKFSDKSWEDTLNAKLSTEYVTKILGPSVSVEYLETYSKIYKDLEKIDNNLLKNLKVISVKRLHPRTRFSFVTTYGAVSFDDSNKIYLNPIAYSITTLAHELAHLQEKNCDNKFFEKWNALVDTSRYEGAQNGYFGPYNGFIRRYGAYKVYEHKSFEGKRWCEDIATHVEELYKEENNLDKIKNKKEIHKQKYKLLYENKFINKKQYEKAIKLIGN